MPRSRQWTALFAILDFFRPHAAKHARTFGIREGMTVMGYGCGPGRCTVEFARLVGLTGVVYAVDVQEMAVQAAHRRVDQQGLSDVMAALARGYDCGLPDGIGNRSGYNMEGLAGLDIGRMSASVRDCISQLDGLRVASQRSV